jgi:hypothetical protein
VRTLRERREDLARQADAMAQMSCSQERLRAIEADLGGARRPAPEL